MEGYFVNIGTASTLQFDDDDHDEYDVNSNAYYTGYCLLFVALMALPLLQHAVCC